MELNQVTVRSADVDRAERFYRELGLRLIVSADGYRRFECPDGDSTFSIESADAAAGVEPPTVYFECDDLDERCARLVDAGLVVDEPPADKPWLWREARLRDPDGNRICLFHAGGNRRNPPWRLESAGGAAAAGAGEPVSMRPIGTVVGGRSEAIDDHWLEVEAVVELDGSTFDVSATAGLEEFSHIEVVYLFHRVDPAAIVSGARHPRGREDWPAVGIFAQRAKMRPNRIGVTVCQLLGVDGLQLRVCGLDAIDGTPVLDVKPHMAEFGPIGPVRQPAWSSELMARYWE